MGKGVYDAEKDLISGLEFIDILVENIKTNKDWSHQQAVFINSVLRSANQDIELYKKVKGIGGK